MTARFTIQYHFWMTVLLGASRVVTEMVELPLMSMDRLLAIVPLDRPVSRVLRVPVVVAVASLSVA